MSKNRKIHIPEDVKEFANANFKKFKKRNGSYYDSKKEVEKSYHMYLIDLFPSVIEFLVKYGHAKTEEVQNTKVECLKKITDGKFVKAVTKTIKNDDIDNIKMLPIIIREILIDSERRTAELKKDNPEFKGYDLTDLATLSATILKKKIKKMVKAGVSSELAFETLSVIPFKSILTTSQAYRLHSLYEVLYNRANTEKVDFPLITSLLIDEDYLPAFILFALLERKEKFARLSDNQKTLYLDITTFCFDTMEKKLKKQEVYNILRGYVNGRIRDEKQGRDTNRRYPLGSISEDEYPRIRKMVQELIQENSDWEKYM